MKSIFISVWKVEKSIFDYVEDDHMGRTEGKTPMEKITNDATHQYASSGSALQTIPESLLPETFCSTQKSLLKVWNFGTT